jgi:single-strand DNA-binding protein
MSDGMNRVILLGNLGTEPELRYTPAGVAVMSLRLATNETWRDKNKELQERTEWHTVVVWGNRAEALSRLLTKGTALLVEGTLRTSTYEKDGQTRYRTEVHARDVFFAGRRGMSAMRDGSGSPPASDGDAGAPAQARLNGFTAPKKQTDPVDELPY